MEPQQRPSKVLRQSLLEDSMGESSKRKREPDTDTARPRKRLKKKSGAALELTIGGDSNDAGATSLELVGALFGDDSNSELLSDDEDLGLPDTAHPSPSLIAPIDTGTTSAEVDGGHSSGGGGGGDDDVDEHPRIREIKRVVVDGLPLLSQTMEEVKARCVFSTSGRDMYALACKDKDVTVPYDFAHQRWAVFARMEGSAAVPSEVGTSPLTRFDNEGHRIPAEAGVTTAWFVVIGDSDALQAICSPFFDYRFSMVQVDPTAIHFLYNPGAPIYRLCSVLEKTPLFSATGDWTVRQLINCLLDTLYAHYEEASTHREATERVRKTLYSIDAFPQAEKPHVKLPPPDRVPLNRFSKRKARRTVLQAKIGKPYGALLKQQDPHVAAPTLPLVACTTLRTSASLLFGDLEKPDNAFQLIAAGMPHHAVSALSDWRQNGYVVACQRTAEVLRALRHEARMFPVSIADRTPLAPSWFSLYYTWFGDQVGAGSSSKCTPRQARINAYRTFVASDLYFTVMREMRTYNRSVVYVWTRARRTKYLDQNLLWISQSDEDEAALNGLSCTTSEAPLTADEQAALITKATTMLDVYSWVTRVEGGKRTRTGKKRFDVVTHNGTVVALSTTYTSVVKQLARMVLDTCNRWTAARSGMPEAVAGTAPLIVKSNYVYAGPDNDTSADNVVGILNANLPAGATVATLLSTDTRAQLRQKMAGATVLVWCHLHQWTLRSVTLLIDAVRAVGSQMSCTHLVVLSHANVVGQTFGESLTWELHDASRAIVSRLLPECTDEHGAAPLLSGPRFAFGSGQRSQHLFPHAARQEQLDHNQTTLLFGPDCGGDKAALCAELVKIKASADPWSVVVLYSRTVSRNKIYNWALGVSRYLVNTDKSALTFIPYCHLDRYVAALKSVVLCVFADVAYEGAGRLTYHHVNSMLERTRGTTLVLGDRARFEHAYRRDDSKTDRLNAHIGRFNFLLDTLHTAFLDPNQLHTVAPPSE